MHEEYEVVMECGTDDKGTIKARWELLLAARDDDDAKVMRSSSRRAVTWAAVELARPSRS